MNSKLKNKKPLIVLLILVMVVLIGFTFAFFSDKINVNNIFKTKPYGTTVVEEFVSPDNWTPGTTTDKTVIAKNTGDVDVAVRVSYTEQWKASDGTILSGWVDKDGNVTNHDTENVTDEKAAIINLDNKNDWIKSTENGIDYYYYNKKLEPGEETNSFLKSVTFNSIVNSDSNCEIVGNTTTCTSTDKGYDGATYTLTITVETVQYDQYKNAWNTDYEIGSMTAVQYLLSKANGKDITNYSDGNTLEMYTFEHEINEQTSVITDYRYIGNKPSNYVYFNDELWRIIGVFEVEDKDGKREEKIKIIRDKDLGSYNKNLYKWNDYYTSLSDTSKDLIGYNYTKYYQNKNSSVMYGSASDMYVWEREPKNEKLIETLNIALMYPSDYAYTYALGVDDKCFSDIANCSIGSPENGWIYNSNQSSTQWLWTNVGNESLIINSSGDIDSDSTAYHCGYGCWFNSYGNRPVIYLKSDIYIEGGKGIKTNPYRLSLKSVKMDSEENYTQYNVGDIINYRGEQYYVLVDEGKDSVFVTLIKANSLTADEVNRYNGGEYTSEYGEIAYDSACDSLGRVKGNCGNSDVMNLLNNWIIDFKDDLVGIDNGYKVRLVTKDELIDNLGYESYYDSPNTYYIPSEDTPDWVYEYSYWIMTPYEDDIFSYIVKQDGSLSTVSAIDKYLVRPVINLKKCAIDNSCND